MCFLTGLSYYSFARPCFYIIIQCHCFPEFSSGPFDLLYPPLSAFINHANEMILNDPAFIYPIATSFNFFLLSRFNHLPALPTYIYYWHLFNSFLSSYLLTNHFITKLRASFHHHGTSIVAAIFAGKQKEKRTHNYPGLQLVRCNRLLLNNPRCWSDSFIIFVTQV